MGQATKIRRSCKGAYTRFGPAGTEDPLSGHTILEIPANNSRASIAWIDHHCVGCRVVKLTIEGALWSYDLRAFHYIVRWRERTRIGEHKDMTRQIVIAKKCFMSY